MTAQPMNLAAQGAVSIPYAMKLADISPVIIQSTPGFAKNHRVGVEASTPELVDLHDAVVGILKDMKSGAGISRIAAGTQNVDAFGIAHLLFNIETKDLLTVEMRIEDILARIMLTWSGDAGMAPDTRHRVIAAMKSLGVIDASLSDKEFKPAGTTPCVRDVGAIIHEMTRVPLEDVASSSRSREVVKARFRAIWVLRKVCGHSLSMIGKHMGNRDHTTILNSINKVMLLIDTDVGEREAIEVLCEKSDMMGVMKHRQILIHQISR